MDNPINNIVPVIIPHENVNDETVKIIQWLVGDGDAVHAGQPLVEVETSKSTFEIESPAAGVVKRVAAEKIEVPVGDILCYVGESMPAIDGFRATLSASPVQNSKSIAPQHASEPKVIDIPTSAVLPPCRGSRFSRAAMELIHNNGLKEDDFCDRGLVRQSDVLAHLGKSLPASTSNHQAKESTRSEPAPCAAAGVPVRSEPMTRTKQFESRLLSWGRRQAIRSSVTIAVPTRGLNRLKQRNPAALEAFSAVVIFEAARLLRKYPHLNAYAADEQVSFYEQVNIGYALDAGQGLKVPVLREADCKTLPELIAQRRQFLADYLNDAIRPEAMAGATFTVTDLSGDDVFAFEPLLVEAQSAILGIGAEFELAGTQASAYNLILAFDHRLVEGRMAARFLGELKERLRAHEEAMPGYGVAGQESDAEPCCFRCRATLSETERVQGFLLQTANPSKNKAKFVCSVCLAGF